MEGVREVTADWAEERGDVVTAARLRLVPVARQLPSAKSKVVLIDAAGLEVGEPQEVDMVFDSAEMAVVNTNTVQWKVTKNVIIVGARLCASGGRVWNIDLHIPRPADPTMTLMFQPRTLRLSL